MKKMAANIQTENEKIKDGENVKINGGHWSEKRWAIFGAAGAPVPCCPMLPNVAQMLPNFGQKYNLPFP